MAVHPQNGSMCWRRISSILANRQQKQAINWNAIVLAHAVLRRCGAACKYAIIYPPFPTFSVCPIICIIGDHVEQLSALSLWMYPEVNQKWYFILICTGVDMNLLYIFTSNKCGCCDWFLVSILVFLSLLLIRTSAATWHDSDFFFCSFYCAVYLWYVNSSWAFSLWSGAESVRWY